MYIKYTREAPGKSHLVKNSFEHCYDFNIYKLFTTQEILRLFTTYCSGSRLNLRNKLFFGDLPSSSIIPFACILYLDSEI